MVAWSTIIREVGAANRRRVRTANTNALLNEFGTPDDEYDEDRLVNLVFNKSTSFLSFKIEHYHRQPKITRYVTRDYVRTPIYEDFSERTKILKTFNKKINVMKFANEDILNLNLHHEFILEILDEIGVNPAWRKQEIKVEIRQERINDLKTKYRNYSNEIVVFEPKPTNYPTKPSNFWVRLLFLPFTLGLSFLNYITKDQAYRWSLENKENEKWNETEEIKVKKSNKKLQETIIQHNDKIGFEIGNLNIEIDDILNEKLVIETEHDGGWLDLIDSSNMYYPNLAGKKGVYIIWNKTKDKYYVGQSKNMRNRLMNHWKDGEPKNIIFAKDFYDGDFFVYRYCFCETKDELDAMEKNYIQEYNAFENGYNKTGGNK